MPRVNKESHEEPRKPRDSLTVTDTTAEQFICSVWNCVICGCNCEMKDRDGIFSAPFKVIQLESKSVPNTVA
jgi:hypothetical protein